MGGRVLAAGISVSASVVLMNVMAASRPATTATVPAAPTSPAAPTVIIVQRPADEHGRDASATRARIERGQPRARDEDARQLTAAIQEPRT